MRRQAWPARGPAGCRAGSGCSFGWSSVLPPRGAVRPPEWRQVWACIRTGWVVLVVRLSDGDADLPSGVAGPDIAEDVGCFVEGVGAVDDRRDLPGREEVGQGEQVLALPERREGL